MRSGNLGMRRGPAWMVATLLLIACRAEPAADASATAATDSVVAADKAPALTSAVDDEDCLPIEPERLWIAGTVRQEPKLGPPGYGETPKIDQKLVITVIDLDHPVDICASASPDEPYDRVADVQMVQLAGNFDPARMRRSISQRIRVHGSLFHQVWGHHFLPILINVDSVAVSGHRPAET
jgi:hypothetical protein